MSCGLKDASTCTYASASGVEYEEFSCQYKFLEPFYLEAEKCFDSVWHLNWTSQHNFIPVVAVCIYLVAIYSGKKAMENRKPFSFKFSMAVWNLILSVFSFGCMARVIPHLIHNVAVGEVRDLVCISPETTYGYGSTGLWVTLFMYSKFAELFDTFFIIAHKKPLMLLHWYHHTSVLVWSWYSFVTRTPSSSIYMAFNASVHALMYGYYFLMTIKMKPKWLNPMWITFAQLIQMVGGLFVTLMSTYYYHTQTEDKPCDIQPGSLIPCYAMYGSYFLLFLQFFMKRYSRKSTKPAKKVE